MSGRGLVVLALIGVLVAACDIDAAPPTILGGAPDTSASAMAERRAALAGLVDEVGTSVPSGEAEVPDVPPVDAIDDGETVPVLLLRGNDPVWVRRVVPVGAPDRVVAALGALAEPLRPAEADVGFATAVPLGTTVRGWNRREGRLELGVEGAAYAGGTTTALRHRALQLACTAAAALDPPPEGVNFVTGAPLDGVSVVDCPDLPG